MHVQEEIKKEISHYIDACMPIIYVDTLEIGMYRALVEEIASEKRMEYAGWSLYGGMHIPGISMPANMGRDLLTTLENIRDDLDNRLFIIEDIGSQLERPEVISYLRHIAEDIVSEKLNDCNIIILSPLQRIPRELELYVTLVSRHSMDNESIKECIIEFCKKNTRQKPEDFVDDFMKTLVTALRGLTKTEIDSILSLVVSKHGRLDMSGMSIIRKEKQQMIKKSGILEMINVKETLDDIGGLERLKSWLKKKAAVYNQYYEAEKWGVDIPKGVLIAGMPGCGKSLAAKAASATFGLPLLRMDMGRLMGKYVGESESNMRRAIELTEASAPCILWIDELEKAFAGIQSGGSGSEVATRLFGNFLTWMQEKDSMAFVVATANDISKLPPELMRKGRFDEIFYVDMPKAEERKKILEIHIKKRRKDDLSQIDLQQVVRETDGFCGADIEGVVRDAIEEAFVAKKDHLDTAELLAAIKRTHPISETMKDSLQAMKSTYKDKKFANASA